MVLEKEVYCVECDITTKIEYSRDDDHDKELTCGECGSVCDYEVSALFSDEDELGFLPPDMEDEYDRNDWEE